MREIRINLTKVSLFLLLIKTLSSSIQILDDILLSRLTKQTKN